MKKTMEFKKRILYLFLVLIALFFGKISFAVANPVTVIESLRQQGVVETDLKNNYNKEKKQLRPYIPCRGMSQAYTRRKVVALTFDDGPHEKFTEEILWILRENRIKATFFFIGRNVDENPEIANEVHDEGHIIGNHTYSHPYLGSLSEENIKKELLKANRSISRIIGFCPVLLRPPYGDCSLESVRIARELGFKTIMWSVDYPMTRIFSPEKIADRILRQVRPGAIILLHDGGGKRENVVEALPMIIENLKEQGYGFVTVPELLNIDQYYKCCSWNLSSKQSSTATINLEKNKPR